MNATLWAAKDNRVKVFLLTGRGKFYSSGQELKRPDFKLSEAESLKQSVTKYVDNMYEPFY
jgi:peroxisomal 3,2-trans-enoyl-CoA isomerase